MGKFCVYKHTSPSGKSYIGITSRKPSQRWLNGGGYIGQPKFYNAIEKYGWENFSHEVLFSGLSEEEACNKEIELIKKYDSIENGYNCSTGGQYGAAGAYKYKVGDRKNGFEIIGRVDHKKLIVRCEKCGREIIRYPECYEGGSIKCRCMIKHHPPKQKRQHRMVTHNGETRRWTEWEKILGINRHTIWNRYINGHPIDEVRAEPGRIVNCLTCGKAFHPVSRENVYCSKDCQWQSMKAKRPERVCAHCGKTFVPARAITKDYKALYCSHGCQIESMRAGNK